MFPAGAAGTGLFILRVCASGTLLTAGLVSLDMSVPTLQTLAIWALIILIFLGCIHACDLCRRAGCGSRPSPYW